MADLVTFTKEHAFFINNTFISNSRLKLTKNKTNAKLRLNFCYLKVIHILHPRYHSKITGYILKSKRKSNYVWARQIIRLIVTKMKMKMKKKIT